MGKHVSTQEQGTIQETTGWVTLIPDQKLKSPAAADSTTRLPSSQNVTIERGNGCSAEGIWLDSRMHAHVLKLVRTKGKGGERGCEGKGVSLMIPGSKMHPILEQELEASAQQLLVQATLEPHGQQLVALPAVLLLAAHADDLIGTQVVQAPLSCSLAQVQLYQFSTSCAALLTSVAARRALQIWQRGIGKRRSENRGKTHKQRKNPEDTRNAGLIWVPCHLRITCIAHPSPSNLLWPGLHVESAQLISSIIPQNFSQVYQGQHH